MSCKTSQLPIFQNINFDLNKINSYFYISMESEMIQMK